MTTAIETLARYVPALVLRRLAAEPSRSAQGLQRVSTAVLFTDISGFTALTERLARSGPGGAEVLSALLNAYFERLIALIAAHGGDVAKLAGDALIALWPATDDEPLAVVTLRAAQCGLAVQETLQDYEAAEGIRLSSKAGIACGDVTAMHVGGVFDRWELMLAGAPLIQMGTAEHQARPGDLVLAPSAWTLVQSACAGTPLAHGCVRLEAIDHPLAPRPIEMPALPAEAEAALLGYLPGAIRARLAAGQTHWLGELRRVTVLFVNLPDLNREGQQDGPDVLERTQTVMRTLQTALYHYEGSVNKLSVDEKGTTLVAALGLPPLAHEDDAVRGVQAALSMQAELRARGVRSAIGVATGRVYCGVIGGTFRREYTIIGDVVNLAARLMQKAGEAPPTPAGAPGHDGILCDAATHQAARARLGFEALPAVLMKGKAQPVPLFRPRGRAIPSAGHQPIVGRAPERALLAERLDALVAGAGGIVLIEGDAGIGKSRLVEDLLDLAHSRGVATLLGAGDAIERSTPYFSWRPVFARLLETEGLDDPDRRRRRVLERLGAAPERLRLAPLLDVLLALDLPDNDVTAPMIGQVRADNLHDLLLNLVQDAALQAPTAVVLEDAHWLDSASWTLATLVARHVRPILLIVVTRPLAESGPEGFAQLAAAPGAARLRLGPLGAENVEALVCQRLGVAALPPAVGRLIEQKAQGNPFFSEELASALRETGLITIADGTCHIALEVDWEAVQFPDSVEGVIIGRIDRLSPAQQMALKAASVIGRLFALRILRDIHPIETDRSHLPEDLDRLERLDLTRLDAPEPDLSYLFKHIITHEVSYNLLLYAHRRRLHREVAAWYERTYAEDLAPYYPLLAHHWGRAEEHARAIDYLEKAGARALRDGAYQEVVRFLGEALALDGRMRARSGGMPGDPLRRARWERQMGKAYLDLGRLAESRVHTDRALALLGYPVPVTGGGLAACYVREVLLQVLHRLWPARFLSRAPNPCAVRCQAAAAYEAIGELCYLNQHMPLGVLAGVRSLNLAEAAGPSPERTRSYALMCLVASLIPAPALTERYGRLATAAAEAGDDLNARAWVLELTGIPDLGDGRWDRGRERLEQAVALSRRIGDWRRWEESLGELARLDYFQGAFEASAAQFAQMLEVARARDHEQARMWGLHGGSVSLLRLGRLAEAAALLAESPAVRGEPVGAADAILGLGLLATLRRLEGDWTAARRAAEATHDWIGRTQPIVNYSLEGYTGAAETFLSLWEWGGFRWGYEQRDLERRARQVCAALRRFARIFPLGRPRSWLCRGLLQWLSGHPARARSSWRRGLRESERMAMPYEQARAHLEIGRHLAAGDPARHSHLARAEELFARLGAAPDLARVREALAE